mmetsp:Transcript_15537/g.35563  ORF Transcript_15537/g.35563 Transcript_15537/m.35563 type:complete len:228 (-) Transcript_15537:1891-2574(-)
MAMLKSIHAMAQTRPKRTASSMSPSRLKAMSLQIVLSLVFRLGPPALVLADTSALFRALRPCRLSRTSLPARLLCLCFPPASSSEELKVSAGCITFSDAPLGGAWTGWRFAELATAGSDTVVAMLTEDRSLGGPFAFAAIRAISSFGRRGVFSGGSNSALSLASSAAAGNRGGSGGGGGSSSLVAGTVGVCQGMVPMTCMTEGSTACSPAIPQAASACCHGIASPTG